MEGRGGSCVHSTVCSTVCVSGERGSTRREGGVGYDFGVYLVGWWVYFFSWFWVMWFWSWDWWYWRYWWCWWYWWYIWCVCVCVSRVVVVVVYSG